MKDSYKKHEIRNVYGEANKQRIPKKIIYVKDKESKLIENKEQKQVRKEHFEGLLGEEIEMNSINNMKKQ